MYTSLRTPRKSSGVYGIRDDHVTRLGQRSLPASAHLCRLGDPRGFRRMSLLVSFRLNLKLYMIPK